MRRVWRAANAGRGGLAAAAAGSLLRDHGMLEGAAGPRQRCRAELTDETCARLSRATEALKRRCWARTAGRGHVGLAIAHRLSVYVYFHSPLGYM